MNSFQEIWWKQARSDYAAFQILRREGAAPCHALHYLQMVTEKLAKAYFWRSGVAPPKSHVGLVQFFRFLGQLRQGQRDRVAAIFSFHRFSDFQLWIRAVLPMVYALERMTPDLAGDGPNPEYPWPHAAPTEAPAEFEFPVWANLSSAKGRDLMRVIRIAIERFPEYADI